MSGFGEAAVGAAASIGVAAYNTLSGFSARHDHSHDVQAAETRRLVGDFRELRKSGDMDDEDHDLYMEKKDIALQSGKAYRDSISEFKSTTTLNPIKKFKKRKNVRKSKRRVREANQSLQDLYYLSCSGGSDASSVTAASGSPPESQAIREWADSMTSATRYARGKMLSNRYSQCITIEGYTLSFHGRLLIQDAEVRLNHGCRYGLLGENGSGKSAFLQSIAERDIATPPHIDIYFVREEADPSMLNAVDFIVASLDNPGCIVTSFVGMNPLVPEDKAGIILRGLGFSEAMMKKPTKKLSGGWLMRVALAQALFVKPHLLLLDEPTNYLDVGAIVWLEAYLSAYNRILVITSQSADFMDNVCTNIIDLTSKKLVYYDGNYSTYVKTKQENGINQMEAYHEQQEKIANLKEFIATAGTNPDLIKQAQAKQKIVDKMAAAGFIEPVNPQNKLRFKFESIQNIPPPIIVFDDVAFSYPRIKGCLYQSLSFGIDMNSRVAILGAKGAGKSTLLNLITGALKPSEGVVSKHSSVRLAKYSQHSAEQLLHRAHDDESPIQYLSNLSGEGHRRTRIKAMIAQLDRFGVSSAFWTVPIKELSGGLRNKIVFAQLAMERPHILLLDEPTNHLDMESVDALARAIKEFQGGLVIVSNNFSFISQVAEELWEVTNKGIRNLTKEGITILTYKRSLVNQVVKPKRKAKAKHALNPETMVQMASSTSMVRAKEKAALRYVSPEPPRRASAIEDPHSLHPYELDLSQHPEHETPHYLDAWLDIPSPAKSLSFIADSSSGTAEDEMEEGPPNPTMLLPP